MDLIQKLESEEVARLAKKIPDFKPGDTIVVTWGSPMGEAGGTNALKIVRVGETYKD